MPRIKSKTSGVVVDETITTENPIEETPEVESESEIEIPEAVTAEDEITMEENIAQKSPVKSVRVCPSEDHSCSIGGVRYFFKKGVCQNVPLEVKEILVKAGLLSPL